MHRKFPYEVTYLPDYELQETIKERQRQTSRTKKQLQKMIPRISDEQIEKFKRAIDTTYEQETAGMAKEVEEKSGLKDLQQRAECYKNIMDELEKQIAAVRVRTVEMKLKRQKSLTEHLESQHAAVDLYKDRATARKLILTESLRHLDTDNQNFKLLTEKITNPPTSITKEASPSALALIAGPQNDSSTPPNGPSDQPETLDTPRYNLQEESQSALLPMPTPGDGTMQPGTMPKGWWGLGGF